MGAYNKINGSFCCENKWLLDDVLRKDWGFKGLVVTDWSANNERVPGLLAGQELEMPASGGVNDQKLWTLCAQAKLTKPCSMSGWTGFLI